MAPSGKKHVKVPKQASDYVHPSLQSTPKEQSVEKNQSISERIEFLRRVQAPRISAKDLEEQQETSSTPAVSSTQRSRHHQPRIAGPRPPKSWTERPNAYKLSAAGNYSFERAISKVDYFPGTRFPPPASLLHQSLKALATGFEWHADFDGVYLSSLPTRCKDLLFSYIARYGPEEGISADELLLVLYCEQELEQFLEEPEAASSILASGCEDLARLDLGGSLGRNLRFKTLERCWHIGSASQPSVTPETWEAAAEEEAQIHSHSQRSILTPIRPRFPSLSRLSLANPGSNASWPEFLHFSQHLTAITHLSLAHWPTPRFSSTTAMRFVAVPIRHPVSKQPDQETRDNAVEALRILSRNTPSLEYLSLAGCETWFKTLMHVPSPDSADSAQHRPSSSLLRSARADQDRLFADPSTPTQAATKRRRCPANAGEGIPWPTTWRHLTTLDLRQSRLPKLTPARTLYTLYTERKGTPNTTSASASASTSGIPGTATAAAGGQETLTARCPYDRNCTNQVHLAAGYVESRRAELTGQSDRYAEPAGLSVSSGDGSVVQRVRERALERIWVEREMDALDVRAFLRLLRGGSGGGRGQFEGGTSTGESGAGLWVPARAIEVLHGWGKEELVGAGYEERELFEAGF